jgi:hypothetical protein
MGSDAHVPVEDPVERTLKSGRFALLHRAARLQPCRVTITATSNAEFNGVRFRTKALAGRSLVFEANEVHLGLFQTLLGATVEAAPPEGVATVDISYVVKTGADAAQ